MEETRSLYPKTINKCQYSFFGFTLGYMEDLLCQEILIYSNFRDTYRTICRLATYECDRAQDQIDLVSLWEVLQLSFFLIFGILGSR